MMTTTTPTASNPRTLAHAPRAHLRALMESLREANGKLYYRLWGDGSTVAETQFDRTPQRYLTGDARVAATRVWNRIDQHLNGARPLNQLPETLDLLHGLGDLGFNC